MSKALRSWAVWWGLCWWEGLGTAVQRVLQGKTLPICPGRWDAGLRGTWSLVGPSSPGAAAELGRWCRAFLCRVFSSAFDALYTRDIFWPPCGCRRTKIWPYLQNKDLYHVKYCNFQTTENIFHLLSALKSFLVSILCITSNVFASVWPSACLKKLFISRYCLFA